jgi:hypothetical protein
MHSIMAFEAAPAEVMARIGELAERIRTARKRRGWTIGIKWKRVSCGPAHIAVLTWSWRTQRH